MKYCIISFIFNNYEVLREIQEKSDNCDYFLFTDDSTLKSSSWNIIYLPEFDNRNLTGVQKTFILKHQLYKYIPNIEQYDYFIRIDHSIDILKPLDGIIDYMDKYKYDIMCSIHLERSNFAKEYDAWITCRGLNPKYKENFFKYCNIDDIGLIETTIMAYKNCKEIFNLMDDMYINFKEYNNCADSNDQCYFTYTLYNHKDKLRILYTNAHLYRNTPLNPRLLQLNWHNTHIPVPDNTTTIVTNIFNKNQIVKINF